MIPEDREWESMKAAARQEAESSAQAQEEESRELRTAMKDLNEMIRKAVGALDAQETESRANAEELGVKPKLGILKAIIP